MYRIAIDRGGTFTDVFAVCPDNRIVTLKLLSAQPSQYSDAPFEAIRRILKADGRNIATDDGSIGSIRMGTTVATNALLEHKGERLAIALTKGFRDVFCIGNQSREDIFELKISDRFRLYEEVVEIDERLVLDQDSCKIGKSDVPIVTGVSGDKLQVWKSIDRQQVYDALKQVYDKGIRSLAVALLHSYTYSAHEMVVEEIAKQIGFEHITLSSQIMPMVRYVPRGMTSITDAYLTPHIRRYIDSFLTNFNDSFEHKKLLFMQSDGGLTTVDNFSGCRSILSGPAGGVIGFALTTVNDIGSEKPIIGFDMGGTSTDVSRYNGRFEHKFESETAGVIIQYPQLDIQTVAAGGGSRLYFRNGLFVVGPESSGSFPGPVCYRNDGFLSVTDANLCLGRLVPDYFPKIFGKDKNMPLDKDAVIRHFQSMANEVNKFCADNGRSQMTIEEVALGFIKVANEAMCRPIRSITQGKGFDVSNHVLTCFGGAGGQHACAIARALGIKQVFIHKYAGILSAYGIALADIVHEELMPCSLTYDSASLTEINQRIDTLVGKSKTVLTEKGFSSENIRFEVYLNLRYERTDFALMITVENGSKVAYCDENNYRNCFDEQYKREFGFNIPGRPILIDDIRVRGIGSINETFLPGSDSKPMNKDSIPIAANHTEIYFEATGYVKTPIYLFEKLSPGCKINGPAMIIESNSTILIEPFCIANVTHQGNILVDVESCTTSTLSADLDPIYLSIFGHVFMSIAEQMGSVLQHTAISTNIKERLDFSCAIFGPSGHLVSNAPHIPVHLGSMSKAVEFQIETLGDKIKPGDVYLTNHPYAGGTHLPDFTVITPVFAEGHSKPIFFVASRAHHADIGGLSPGSMPSNSTNIYQEGASFISFKLVENGVFLEKELTEALMLPGQYPDCSGTRTLNDNLSDLKAQIAANLKGVNLVNDLINSYGVQVVLAYMGHIQQMLNLKGSNTLNARDMMDDGSVIELYIEIDPLTGDAIFDFTGTGEQVYGNCNAPTAVTYSAIIYCLRCMIGHDIPLNHGCLAPITVRFPPNSIISPSLDAAVVGVIGCVITGNVLTSQRITDVIFRAFESCAASQGCMNNITFGDETVGYYETVAGGAGATDSNDGRSGVHTHMTNTRITDVEILEKRYPVVVNTFTLNPDTGGKGTYHGGDGILRELLFRKNLTLSILTERRVLHPYGLKGGQDGKRGKI
ncbi:hypothetical protein BLOT_007670 [Blomia tropicalis]|nr:hypothetical protein BLOT_007670 [Blomia tropicalis]